MSLAKNRQKRSTAGNRMGKLLEKEDRGEPEHSGNQKDEFYQTAYGGFLEEMEDINYSDDSQADHDSDDSVDSDFDIDEDDEIRSEEEEADMPERKKRKKDINKNVKAAIAEAQMNFKKSMKSPISEWSYEEQKKYHMISIDIKRFENIKMISKLDDDKLELDTNFSTSAKTVTSGASSIAMKLIDAQRKERERKKKEMENINTEKFMEFQMKKLEVAKLNEYLNKKSLNAYRINEADIQKAKRMLKKQYQPIITTHSIKKNDNITCLITYHNANDVKKQKSCPLPKQKICVITGLPAKYTDPLTGKHFRDLSSLQIIRQNEKLPFRQTGQDLDSYEMELNLRKPEWFTKLHIERIEQSKEINDILHSINNHTKPLGIDLTKTKPTQDELNRFKDLILSYDFLEIFSPIYIFKCLPELDAYRGILTSEVLFQMILKYKAITKIGKTKINMIWHDLFQNKVWKNTSDKIFLKNSDLLNEEHPSATPSLKIMNTILQEEDDEEYKNIEDISKTAENKIRIEHEIKKFENDRQQLMKNVEEIENQSSSTEEEVDNDSNDNFNENLTDDDINDDEDTEESIEDDEKQEDIGQEDKKKKQEKKIEVSANRGRRHSARLRKL